ncbi:MAG: hypothetical protein ABSF48_20140 [Thermodesulfobacteriota bacterium]|jgi:hypothetical protein
MNKTVQELLSEIFWTEAPTSDESRPTDPLGLDAMREELSDKLVPCLTSRTSRHEDFFWALTFLRWSASEATEKKREERFLHWERCLKIYWIKFRKNIKGFPGINQARSQASRPPSLKFQKLLKVQRAQGMLGAHLGPLRQLGLAKRNELVLENDGIRLVEGVGNPPDLKENWESWKRGFDSAGRAFDVNFKIELRKRLHQRMPELYNALSALRWRANMGWGQAAKHMGPRLEPYANLAHVFCPWADTIRSCFDEILHYNPDVDFPPWLRGKIPTDLKRWDPLRKIAEKWKKGNLENVLADLHKDVFFERGYSRSDLWISIEDGRLLRFPGRADYRPIAEGSDCRWSNAVALMRPFR